MGGMLFPRIDGANGVAGLDANGNLNARTFFNRRSTPPAMLPRFVDAADYYAGTATVANGWAYAYGATIGMTCDPYIARASTYHMGHRTATYNTSTHWWDCTGHNLATADEVQLKSSGTLPDGVSQTTRYFVLKADDNRFSLHLTRADAVANTNRITSTTTGTGTHYVMRLPRSITIWADASGTPSVRCYLGAAPIDLTAAKLIRVDWNVLDDSDTGGALPTSVQLRLNTDASNYRTLTMGLATATYPRLAAGRYVWFGTISAASAADVGTFNPASVAYAIVLLGRSGTDRPKIAIDRLMFGTLATTRATALYIPTIDDGYAEAWMAAGYLAGHGLVGNFFVPGSYPGETNRLTWTQCQYMAEMGHAICNHAYAHAHWPSLTAAGRLLDYRHAISVLDSYGLSDSSRIFRPPGGYFSADEKATWAEQEIELLAGTTPPGQGDSSIRQIATIGERDPYLFCSDNSTRAGTAWTRAKSDSGIALPLNHKWDDEAKESEPWATWAAHIDSVAADLLAGTGRNITLAQYSRAAF